MSLFRYVLYLLSITIVFAIIVLPITYVLVKLGCVLMLAGVPLAVYIVLQVKPLIGSWIYRYDVSARKITDIYDGSVHATFDKFDYYIQSGALVIFLICAPLLFECHKTKPTMSEAFDEAVRFTLLFSVYMVCCAVALQILRFLISCFRNRSRR